MLLLLIACGSVEAPIAEAPSAPAASAPKTAPPAPAKATPGSVERSAYGLRGVDWACAVCDGLGLDQLAKVTPSSTLKGHGWELMFDNDLGTAWCEGVEGAGVGESIAFEFKKPLMMDAVGLWGGYFKTEDLLAANGRVDRLLLKTSTGKTQSMAWQDPSVVKTTDASMGPEHVIPTGEWFQWVRGAEPARVGVPFEEEMVGFELEIQAVYSGGKYSDTCISELDILVVDPAEL